MKYQKRKNLYTKSVVEEDRHINNLRGCHRVKSGNSDCLRLKMNRATLTIICSDEKTISFIYKEEII